VRAMVIGYPAGRLERIDDDVRRVWPVWARCVRSCSRGARPAGRSGDPDVYVRPSSVRDVVTRTGARATYGLVINHSSASSIDHTH
jgi:hypothetical protein